MTPGNSPTAIATPTATAAPTLSVPVPGLRAYPVPDHGEDPRFCFGLVAEVASLLRAHGYPEPQPGDLGDLLLTLFRFLYRSEAER